MAQHLNEGLTNAVSSSIKQLAFYRNSNAVKDTYVKGENCLSNLSIFIDDRMGDLGISLPWSRLAVTAVHDRMQVDAIYVDDEEENEIIQEILDENDFLAKFGESLYEALKYGCSYMLSNYGNGEFEPSVKMTSESPNLAFGEYDAGSRLLNSLLKVRIEKDAGGRDTITYGEIYLPDVILYFRVNNGSQFEILQARKGFGYVPGVKLVNSEDGSLGAGESEVNHTIRRLSDFALTQFSNMRVASDAYGQPITYIVGAGVQPHESEGGAAKPIKLNTRAGSTWAIPNVTSKDGKEISKPEVGQLSAGKPDTYITIAEALVKQLAMATRIPESQLGVGATNIPASAEAIKNNEQPFTRRIEKKQRIFTEPIQKIVRIAYQMKTGKKLTSKVRVKWVEAGTNTLASNTDAMTKAIAAGVLPATSDFVYDKLGVPYSERKKIREELNKGQNSLLVKAILEKSAKVSQTDEALNTPTGEELEEGGLIE